MAKEQFATYEELYNERHKTKEQTWEEAYGDGENKKAAAKALKPIAQQIDEWDRSGRKRDVFFDYGSPSEAFSQAGISDEKIQLDASKVLKILKEHSEMQLDDFKKLDRIIKHPVIILESKNKDAGESYVVYGQASASNGKPIMISIRVGLKGGVSSIENVSKITSAYTRRNAQNLINTSVVKWVNPDKKRTTYWMYSFGLQLPSATPQSSSSTNSIPQKAKNVKPEDVKDYNSTSFGEKGVQERDSIAPDIVERLVKENMPRAKAEKLVNGVIARLYELGQNGKKYNSTYYEGVLSEQQAKQIYHAGAFDAKEASIGVFHKDAHIIKDDNFKAAKISATDERLIQALSTFTGRNVRFAKLPAGQNAYIDASKGEIVINVNARRHVRTHVIHEAIHSLRMSNPGEYNKLSKAVADIIFKTNSVNDFRNYRVIVANAYMNELADENGVLKYGWEEKLKEETICDVFANVISNSDLIKKLGRENAKGLMRGVYAIQDFVSSVREKFSDNKDIPREAKVAYKLLASRAEALDKSFTESIKKAFPEGVESRRSDKTLVKDNFGVKHSRDLAAAQDNQSNIYDYTKSFAQQVDDWIAGKIPKYDSLLVSGTPKVFTDIGFNALPMTIDQSHVSLAINGGKEDHKIGAKKLKKLPEALKSPIAIFESATAKGRVVALLEINYQGKSVIAPVEIDGFGRQNDITIDSNDIVSVHGRSNAVTGLLKDAVIKEYSGKVSLFYWDKKRALTLLQAAGLQLPSDLPQDGSIHSIRENGSNVKPKFTDVTQTQQFKRWFGDSKVVNEDGTPKVVYHGSENFGFTTFKSGTKFFTDDVDVATSYSQDGKGVSNIDTSLYTDVDSLSIDELVERINNQVFADDDDKLIVDTQKYDTTYYKKGEAVGRFINSNGDGIGTYSISSLRSWIKQLGFNGGVYAVYLKMTNPLVIEDVGGFSRDLRLTGKIAKDLKGKTDTDRVAEYAKEHGYDGVIFREIYDMGYKKDIVKTSNIYVVFDSTQIKSATDNIGTFDGSNPDIRYSKGLKVIDIGDDIETSERKTEAEKVDRHLMTRQARIDRWRLGEGFDSEASDTGKKSIKPLSTIVKDMTEAFGLKASSGNFASEEETPNMFSLAITVCFYC